jgi:hypothetical protein
MITLKLISQNKYRKLNPHPVTSTTTYLLLNDKLNRIDITPLTALIIETFPISLSLRDRLCRTYMSPPMALTGTTAPPLVESNGASMILMLTLVKRDGMESSAWTSMSPVLPWPGAT